MELRGKKYWLIGASDGIGHALALALDAEGVTLALSARNGDKLAALAGQCKSVITPLVVPLDVTDRAQMEAAFHHITATWGRIDGFIYVAGYYQPMPVTALEHEVIEQTLAVNLGGVFTALDYVIPHMLQARAGHIVLFGSVAGYRGLPKAYAYGTTKAAVNHLAEILAVELYGSPITVQRVCPGFVKTQLTDKNDFAMPMMISVEEAARETVKGMKRGAFEIHYPKRFTLLMKLLSALPFPLYRWLMNKAKL